MVGGRDSLPEFNVKSFLLPAEIDELDAAMSAFIEDAIPAFNRSNQSAQDVVKLTHAWIGVGERVVALLNTVASTRMKNADGDRAAGLQKLVEHLSSMGNAYGAMKNLLT